ncbi:uncharacterized protein [Drosophila pseudoobscura]|uniref:Uncharacterized protein n=1 Tax=Drosophila pseudoobscura pseudoobscura TaxID=46245 RepID=A0A6I8V0T7_DROPS|nr:uncharacterized protein LOC6901764 [Drosophila pseudoobscura]
MHDCSLKSFQHEVLIWVVPIKRASSGYFNISFKQALIHTKMKHSFAVVGLLLALYSTQPSTAIGGPCDLMFDSAKAMCESGSIKNNCAEINQGIEAFTKLVQAAQSKFCAFPSPIWLLCKYCKASESESSQLENEGNGTATAGTEIAPAAETVSPPVIRSHRVLEPFKLYTHEA